MRSLRSQHLKEILAAPGPHSLRQCTSNTADPSPCRVIGRHKAVCRSVKRGSLLAAGSCPGVKACDRSRGTQCLQPSACCGLCRAVSVELSLQQPAAAAAEHKTGATTLQKRARKFVRQASPSEDSVASSFAYTGQDPIASRTRARLREVESMRGRDVNLQNLCKRKERPAWLNGLLDDEGSCPSLHLVQTTGQMTVWCY
jgi:hypothetical protein